MRESEQPPQVVTEIAITGGSLDELLQKAKPELDSFFGGHEYEIRAVRARPLAQAFGGQVFVWEGTIEAGRG